MSFGQTYASDAVRPLFNSAAPVVAVAGLVALAARHAWSSMLLGATAGPTLVAGYYVTSHVRGFANSTSNIALWGAAGIAFGAAMGLATRHRDWRGMARAGENRRLDASLVLVDTSGSRLGRVSGSVRLASAHVERARARGDLHRRGCRRNLRPVRRALVERLHKLHAASDPCGEFLVVLARLRRHA